ncbi:hypothetical protein [Caenimonas aquaedulcis]|uniref:DUF2116 family Zn-ribbon domain-containing protein n=1 Tax=Caenimonas aquaedulcis TaxID=2793270 RepID=A0A931H8C1_9BURK|nr:hypothetical protein [Caenimonas aquaedulcis]MBG9390579.1 hypothetical protein [Caenimonas aquaedulcis]
MDEADLAFDAEQRHFAQALAAQRSRAGRLRPIGSCHYCEEQVTEQDRLFCNADCAADWEYENSLRTKLGLPAGGLQRMQ